ncbi:DNA polymerase III subunit delta' [Alkalinema sp. FACHB-956]|uniref:DNA polymerase III subunit delta' n=1 Tax=Alkalinema sp. FACHB-956 TaxID=2692768 RepID=UPI0016890E6D|nr:DNA polymerase III subunit delta' [Alkalinema sp. FACHB-956]MBD2329701.1 DNA polymerase III subunit delta' [Alkalinema sp. FACHB-956]
MSTVFAPLIGQPAAIELLTQAVSRDRIAPAYLFTGANGIGKRLTAQCFLQLLLSPNHSPTPALTRRIQQRNHPDLLWVEPTYLHQGKRLTAQEAEAAGAKRKTPPIIRLEQIREISQFLSRPPLEAPRSVIVLEAAHTMPEAAANGLLKTLEEPGQATLILLAPSPEALLPTIVSRCQTIPFYRLSPDQVADVLRHTDRADILNQPEILDLAQGSPGDAIAQWEKLQTIPPDLLTLLTQRPTSLRDALTIAKQIAKTLDTEAQLWLLDYLQQTYWRSTTNLSLLQPLEQAKKHLAAYVQPQLVWEVALMKLMQA